MQKSGPRRQNMKKAAAKTAIKTPCVIMRGGTSKGVFFYEKDIPASGAARDRFLLRAMGSPDPRQIDGLGGADALTSKVAIIGHPSSHPEADIDYTFAQVDIGKPLVDYIGNCGNISAGAGLFAVEENLVKLEEPYSKVAVYNTNTKKILNIYVPVKDGQCAETGDYSIDGVPGTAPGIKLDFSLTGGAASGKLLPTGNRRDTWDIPGFGPLEVSLVDIANPVVFVRAADLKLGGRETPAQIDSNPQLLELLERIRGIGARQCGLTDDWEKARIDSPANPLLAMVSRPTPEEMDKGINLVSRIMFMQLSHKAYSGTGGTCTGAAAYIPGTIANQCAELKGSRFGIGHPCGVMYIDMDVECTDTRIEVKLASFGRTARRIMDGMVYTMP
jgi:2-methylaconitate cis-trans-isomerase PrpF